jgi:hypothetical protein
MEKRYNMITYLDVRAYFEDSYNLLLGNQGYEWNESKRDLN